MSDKDGELYYKTYDSYIMDAKEYADIIAKSWINLQGVADYARDGDIDSLKEFDPYNVETLVNYHGYENIFGACYGSFEII